MSQYIVIIILPTPKYREEEENAAQRWKKLDCLRFDVIIKQVENRQEKTERNSHILSSESKIWLCYRLETYPKYLSHTISKNVESLAKSDELSKSNFLKGIQEDEIKNVRQSVYQESLALSLLSSSEIDFKYS